MIEESVRNMPHMTGQHMGSMHGTMIAATGFAAGRGLLGGLLRNPLVLLAAGVAAGYYLHKHKDEVVLALSKASGMGKDFLLQQKESLADLVEESKEQEAQSASAMPE